MYNFRAKQPRKRKSTQMVSRLDETWRVVIISPTMFVVKSKGGYDKNQWYSVNEVVPQKPMVLCVRSCTSHFKASVFLPKTPALQVLHIIFK